MHNESSFLFAAVKVSGRDRQDRCCIRSPFYLLPLSQWNPMNYGLLFTV